MMRSLLFALLAATFMTTACKPEGQPTHAPEQQAIVSGTITYRERIALSPEAVVEISLQDVSLADAPAVEIARQRISRPGQVPIRFEIRYDPAAIDERMSYSVRANITDRGQLMFTSDTTAPVLTRGAGTTVNMTLVRVAATESSPGMVLEGMFRYMADAALFRDCRDNRTYPVSMEGAYIELERAYLNSGIEPGSEVLVQLKGRLLERPDMDTNNNRIKLIVDIFNNLQPDKTCAPTTHAELINTYWRLHTLGSVPVTTPDGMKEAHMILAADESRVHGNAGCNNFFGQFSSGDSKLSFSAVGSTMMACPEAMDTEQAFLGVLGNTAKYSISGLFLELYDAEGVLLARLEAVYL